MEGYWEEYRGQSRSDLDAASLDEVRDPDPR
jgi:hypothetical protein